MIVRNPGKCMIIFRGETMLTFNEKYDILRECLNIPEETLDLVFGISGCNDETVDNIVYYYTGENLEQFCEEEGISC